MKKCIPLLIICLAVICLFSSCGELERIMLRGTWTVDYEVERSYHKYEYFTYEVVFAGDQVQMIKKQYDSPAHKTLISTHATEAMPYTIGTDGVVTVKHNVSLVNTDAVTDTFTMDKMEKELVWKQGYEGDVFTLGKKSNDTNFSNPDRAFEKFQCEYVIYKKKGEEYGHRVEKCNLFLYADGQYVLEYVNNGRWKRSTSEPDEFALEATDNQIFEIMNLKYDAKWRELEDIGIKPGTAEQFEDSKTFRYTYSWYRDFFTR